jgi:2-polyprenyl-3-methyl-5-hydroxy-6-metoxy-1,4-benzoquinol methylase
LIENKNCKICNSTNLDIIYHVAICRDCEVLLFYPYPESDKDILKKKKYTKDNIAANDNKEETRTRQLNYILESGSLNIENFKHMINFSIPKSLKNEKLKILDYGGGGGQFASVCKLFFPFSKVYITDLYDEKLLEKYELFNHQIKFDKFENDEVKFDFIFLNDVFEHLSDPIDVLNLLQTKLINHKSRIFIDTPKKFWLYDLTSLLNRGIYKKILHGTVDQDHQQIWSKKSFRIAVKNSGLKIDKYKELTEFTQQPSFYLNAMRIENLYLRILGKIFYFFAPIIARNKIISTLRKD